MPSRSDAPAVPGGPTQLLRGVFLVLVSFIVLSIALSLSDDSRAQGRTDASDEPDYPTLFRAIDRRLERSYLDLGRIEPRRLVERALGALELAADEIYVEEFDKPYVALHVEQQLKVLNLEKVDSRSQALDLLERVFEFVSRHYHGEKALNELRYAAANGFLSGI
ncbi:MAG: hypothetical protein AAF488_14435, partial [Planctomycetota bacterium]